MPPALVLALVLLTGAVKDGATTSVAFDLRGLSAAAYHDIDGLTLERKVALRLVQEGFAVMAPASGADVEVRLCRESDGLLLSALLRDDPSPLRRTLAAPEGSLSEWHLEVAHKVSEMARALAATKLSARAAPAVVASLPTPPPPRAPATTTVVAVKAAPPSAEGAWEVGLGAGALWRRGGTDPMAGLLATHARGRLRLHLDLMGARSRGEGIDVWEGEAMVGVSAAAMEGPVGVDVGLGAGVVAQHFNVTSSWATDRAGTRAGPGVWLPLRARWAWRRLVLSLRAAVGLARPLDHTSEGAVLWSRGALRLESMLILAWTF